MLIYCHNLAKVIYEKEYVNLTSLLNYGTNYMVFVKLLFCFLTVRRLSQFLQYWYIIFRQSSKAVVFILCCLISLFYLHTGFAAFENEPTIAELEQRSFLDDYYSNVVFGYHIINDTQKYAPRYNGGKLSCKNCHLQAGTKQDALPLNVLGMYPKWRAKNGKHNGIGLRIRECFLYSMNGFLPPENAPEVLAIAAYISYLSKGEKIGVAPEGSGVPTLETTGFDPNPSRGQTIYKKKCALCHGDNGTGSDFAPPVAGVHSYNAGAGMHKIQITAGFIWANMPLGGEKTLSTQESLDVAAYLHIQLRGADPRDGKILKLLEPIGKWLGLLQ